MRQYSSLMLVMFIIAGGLLGTRAELHFEASEESTQQIKALHERLDSVIRNSADPHLVRDLLDVALEHHVELDQLQQSMDEDFYWNPERTLTAGGNVTTIDPGNVMTVTGVRDTIFLRQSQGLDYNISWSPEDDAWLIHLTIEK